MLDLRSNVTATAIMDLIGGLMIFNVSVFLRGLDGHFGAALHRVG